MYSQSIVANHLLGKSIGGYQIDKLLGQSSISAIYLAQARNQSVVFITFTLPDRFSLQSREQFNERFMRISAALARLRHQHIVSVYDFGMQPGYLYMATALTPAGTLAALLQHQARMSTAYILDIMRQVAEGVDYAHRSSVMHGSLNSASLLLDGGQQIQIAGFGLVQILALSGIEPFQQPYTHVLSVAMTFLGSPASIAPEVVQGMPVDPAADLYALGILLFEMLSGKLPFTGDDPLKTALARLNQPIPSIRELRPDLPASLDLVLQRALQPDPVQRYPSAGSLVRAFEQALREGDTAKQVAVTAKQRAMSPTVENGNLDDSMSGGGEFGTNDNAMDLYQRKSSEVDRKSTGPLSASTMLQSEAMDDSTDSPAEGAIDPFARWSPAALSLDEEQAFKWEGSDDSRQRPTPAPSTVNKKRRRIVTALLIGGVALGGLGTGGVALAHLLQGSPDARKDAKQASTRGVSQSASPSQATKTIEPSPTATSKPDPTATPEPSPTPRPSPTPSHTGVVIGSTNQAANSSKTFVNPLDGGASLLVSLPGGNFVAFESACTHEGVRVYYDAASHKLVCPRHNALFDPAQGAAVLQGPPHKPLPTVPIHVNGDGTITVS